MSTCCFALCLPCNTHTEPIFKQLKILKVHQINHFRAVILMHKLDHHMLPTLFDPLFSKTSSVHSHNVRTSQNYTPIFAKSNIKHHSILCLGPRIYARIPLNITHIQISQFPKRLFKQLITATQRCFFNLLCSIPYTNTYFTH